MFKKQKASFLKILFPIMIFHTIAFSQSTSQTIIIKADSTCSYASAILNSFINGVESDKNIIMISYKGRQETNTKIAITRLKYAKLYITEYYKPPLARAKDKVIDSVGINLVNDGKLDFYVDGRLGLTIFFPRNRSFRLASCYSNE